MNNYKKNKTKIVEIEVPINSKKLKFLGYMHPNDLGIFDAWKVSSQNSNSINKQLYIYQYEDFYISTENDDSTSQINIFYTIRAIILLKYYFPTVYNRLFLETKNHISKQPKFTTFLNSNKAFWIAYNTTPDYIAKSQTSFLSDGYFPTSNNQQIEKYKNIPIIDIHSENIKGINKKNGSFPIYKKTKSTENYLLYMKEGIIETFTHEMLHRYVDFAYPHSNTFFKIKSFREGKNNLIAEECGIMNTSLSYYLKSGYFTNAIFEYYTPIFDANSSKMKSEKIYKTYSQAFKTWKKKNFNTPKEVFILDILE